MRKRLAAFVMCLGTAAVLLPATPAAATTCVINNVVKDTVPCVRGLACIELHVCV
ncbi:MAG TPA: hypothetical protein VG318_00070 [Actinomycetota bacterium]|nr:hypothetical protein [Actinomycetota bacterium]